jgi:hypothetical protein
MDEKQVSPQDNLFDPLILQLLSTVVKYKQLMGNEFDGTFSFKDFYNGYLKYLCTHHSHLTMAFEEDVKDNKNFLSFHSFRLPQPFAIVPVAHQNQDTAITVL